MAKSLLSTGRPRRFLLLSAMVRLTRWAITRRTDSAGTAPFLLSTSAAIWAAELQSDDGTDRRATHQMELIGPANVRVDEVTTAMLGDVADLARQINDIRPLSEEVLRQLKDKLLGERVFSSNAIEGNTLTIRETRLILQTKTIHDVRRMREAQEALNLAEAARRIEEFLDEHGAWYDSRKFLSIHEVLMKGVNDAIAGVIRHRDVMIRGARQQPPGWEEIPNLLDSVFTQLSTSENVNGLILAAWVHWAIARVHPFEDGNGRMARLWQDLMLLRSRLTVAIIRPQDREVYLDALAQADEGSFNPLAQLMCQRVMGTLQTYINAQEEADQLRGWAAELVGEASAHEAEKRRLAYQRWRHAVEQIRDSFERCAALINRGADAALEVQVEGYQIIDQPTWETLVAGGAAKKTWFFKTWFRKNEKLVWYYFFFGKHFWSFLDEQIGEDGPWVNIMVSEQHPDDDVAIKLDDRENSPISLRELIVVNKRIVQRRWDRETPGMVYDLDATPIDVAKKFFEEVLLLKLT
jgi:fido (protein-threonine AMPylation protein)